MPTEMEAATPTEKSIDIGQISRRPTTGSSDEEDDRHSEEETVCRICSFGPERELMHLGCDCRGDLALVHPRCARRWFLIRGSRDCEICGSNIINKIIFGKAVTSNKDGGHHSRHGRRLVQAHPNPPIIIMGAEDEYSIEHTCVRISVYVFIIGILLIFWESS